MGCKINSQTYDQSEITVAIKRTYVRIHLIIFKARDRHCIRKGETSRCTWEPKWCAALGSNAGGMRTA